MRSKLKRDLNDNRITELCDNIYYYIKPEDKQADLYIEYRILGDYERNFAGNKNLTELYLIQVDVFSKGSYKNLVSVIKTVLKEKNYTYVDGVELYEEDTKLYHKAMRFKYSMFI